MKTRREAIKTTVAGILGALFTTLPAAATTILEPVLRWRTFQLREKLDEENAFFFPIRLMIMARKQDMEIEGKQKHLMDSMVALGKVVDGWTIIGIDAFRIDGTKDFIYRVRLEKGNGAIQLLDVGLKKTAVALAACLFLLAAGCASYDRGAGPADPAYPEIRPLPAGG